MFFLYLVFGLCKAYVLPKKALAMRLPRFFPLLLCALLFAAACDTGDPRSGDGAFASDQGLITVASDTSFAATVQRLLDSLEATPNVTVVTDFSHSGNAANAGLMLDLTRVVIFGNPALGTPLMQERRSIGIDLPQKMLVYEDADGNVVVAYNDSFYLAQRHGLPEDTEQLQQIADALSGLAAAATEEE